MREKANVRCLFYLRWVSLKTNGLTLSLSRLFIARSKLRIWDKHSLNIARSIHLMKTFSLRMEIGCETRVGVLWLWVHLELHRESSVPQVLIKNFLGLNSPGDNTCTKNHFGLCAQQTQCACKCIYLVKRYKNKEAEEIEKNCLSKSWKRCENRKLFRAFYSSHDDKVDSPFSMRGEPNEKPRAIDLLREKKKLEEEIPVALWTGTAHSL